MVLLTLYFVLSYEENKRNTLNTCVNGRFKVRLHLI